MKQINNKLHPFRWFILSGFILSNIFIGGNSLVSGSVSADFSNGISEVIISVVSAILPPARVVVVPPEEVTLTLQNNANHVYIGTSNRITATITPVNTTDKSLTWTTSDASIIEITNGGIAIARDFGEATITATSVDETIFGTISIEVIDFPDLADFTLEALIGSTPTATIEKDTTAKIKISNLTPSNAKIPSLSYASSNQNIATVNEDGVIYGVDSGEVSITASFGSLSKSIDLTIIDEIEVIQPTTLTLTGDSIGYVGRNFSLTPSFGEITPTDQQVTFTSSDVGVARINDQGLVMPVNFSGYAPRQVTISVYANANPSLEDSLVITIEKVFPLSLSITASATVENGKTINISPVFFPLDVTDKQLNYVSSDPNIASVSSSGDFGVILGKSVGIVTITASSVMDDAVQATLQVEILPASLLTQDVIRNLYLFVRKGIGHMGLNFFNGILGYLTFFSFFYDKKNRYLWMSLLTGLVLGFVFEGLQFFAPGRTPIIDDVVYNTLGYTIAQFFMLTLFQLIHMKRKPKKT